MSYGYRFTGDALADFRELDIPWQEDVLDELEALVTRPPADDAGQPIRHYFGRESDDESQHFLIRAVWTGAAGTLLVLGIRTLREDEGPG